MKKALRSVLVIMVSLVILLVTSVSVSARGTPGALELSSPPSGTVRATTALTAHVYLPLIVQAIASCAPTGETYGTIETIDPASGDMSTHPDVNLAVRGYTPTVAYLSLVDYGGDIDPNAPQLSTLFTDNRTPIFNAAYKVYRWDWACNCRVGPILKWAVTLLGMETTPGEIIRLPVAGYDIGLGYGALVLYAEPTRVTLKYTREDNVIAGYTIHLENICVDPNLLALYRQMNAASRVRLPALFPGQSLGRARGTEIDAATRDSSSFLDPRTRKDWWQGR